MKKYLLNNTYIHTSCPCSNIKTYKTSNKKTKEKPEKKTSNAFLSLKMRVFDSKNGGNGING
jgi:hypothetical protein